MSYEQLKIEVTVADDLKAQCGFGTNNANANPWILIDLTSPLYELQSV